MGEPIYSIRLPKKLKEFFEKHGEGVIFTPAIVNGKLMTVVVAHTHEVLRTTPVPVQINVQTIRTPFGSLIRFVITIFDDILNPLELEFFANPEKEDHVKDLLRLEEQDRLPIFFVKEGKIINCLMVTLQNLKGHIKRHIETAIAFNEILRLEGKKIDFNKAKEYFMSRPIIAGDEW